MQKLVRAAFGTNNVDTCARVCHSPTGYGLKHTLGESAGTQEFVSVQHADVIMVIGASPTEAHPVFASQMKRRLRAGAQAHRHRSARHRAGEVAARRGRLSPAPAARHERRRHQCAGARGGDRRTHEGATTSPSAASSDSYEKWKKFVADPVNSPEAMEKVTRRAGGADSRRGAPVRAAARTALSTTVSASPNTARARTMVMGIANLAMATGNLGREGVGVSPLRGQNNVQGSCDMGSFPHEFRGYRHVSDDATRALFESMWKVQLGQRARAAHSQHVRSGARWLVPRAVHPGRGFRAVRSEHRACDRGAVGHGMHRHPGHLPQRDRRDSRMCSCRALRSWRRTARSRMPSGAFRACARSSSRWRDSPTGKSRCACRMRSVIRMNYTHPSQIMDEIARAHAHVHAA